MLTKGSLCVTDRGKLHLATAAVILLLASVPAMLAQQPGADAAALRSAANQIKLKHFKAAQEILQRILNEKPTAEADNLLGIALAKMGEIGAARTSFERAIALDEKFPPAYVNLADLLLNAGDETTAMRFFKAALALDPSILTRDPSSYVHFNMWGLCLVDAQRYSQAAQAFQRSIRINPRFAPAHVNLGEALVIMRREDQALREFLLALTLQPKDVSTNNDVALIYGRMGKFALASKYLRQAHKLNPDDSAITARLMATELQLGHRAEAQTLLIEPGLWDSMSTSARETMAVLWLKNGSAQTGAEVVNGDQEASRSYYQLAYTTAEEDLDEGRYAEAANVLEAIYNLLPPSAEFHDLLGSANYALGNSKKAFDEFQIALQMKPADPDYYYKLGMVFLKNHTPDPAISVFEGATKIRPDVPKLWFGLGMSYYFASHLAQAEKTLREALALDPRYQKAYVVLGDLLYQSGRADEAVTLLRKAIDLQPDWYLPYYFYGMIALRRGQEKSTDVIEALRRATTLNPRFAEAHCELGKALARTGERQEAIRELEKSVELDSGMAEPHYQMATIYRALGDRRQAAEQLALFTSAKKKSNPDDLIAKELQSVTSIAKEQQQNHSDPAWK